DQVSRRNGRRALEMDREGTKPPRDESANAIDDDDRMQVAPRPCDRIRERVPRYRRQRVPTCARSRVTRQPRTSPQPGRLAQSHRGDGRPDHEVYVGHPRIFGSPDRCHATMSRSRASAVARTVRAPTAAPAPASVKWWKPRAIIAAATAAATPNAITAVARRTARRPPGVPASSTDTAAATANVPVACPLGKLRKPRSV